MESVNRVHNDTNGLEHKSIDNITYGSNGLEMSQLGTQL